MASIHKKAGASGRVSPYWQAKFRGQDGHTLWRSTKQTDSRKALEVERFRNAELESGKTPVTANFALKVLTCFLHLKGLDKRALDGV